MSLAQTKNNWKYFFRALLTIALPIALQNLLATTASMVDTIMIGSRGQLSVAAVGICSQIGSLFFSSYYGFSSGSILFFSQYWGEKNERGINKTFGISFICMSFVSVAFMLAAVIRPDFLLSVYTDKQSIIDAGIPYMRIVGFSFPLQVMAVLISQLMRSTERVKAPLICSTISLVVNFGANWVLIYGRFGAPEMGAAGAAVGTLASSAVNLILLTICFLRSDCDVKLHIMQVFAFDKAFLKAYLLKCFPILCNEILYGIGQMIINIVIGHQNESAIAAMAAFRVCEGFVYAFFGGLSNATSVMVGKEIGAGNLEDGYRFAKKSLRICPCITFIIVGTCAIFYHPLFTLFGLESQAIRYGKYMLLIYLFFGSVRTCDYIMNESYRAGGETVFGTILEVTLLYTITAPATWVAGMVLHLPFLAVFAFVYTDELIRLFVMLRYTNSGKWVKPVTELGKKALPEFLDRRSVLYYNKRSGEKL